ncbi:hypothetical protein PAMP_010595 [Pampus punctatissimus]
MRPMRSVFQVSHPYAKTTKVRIHGNKDKVQTNSGGYSSPPTVGPSRRNPASS